jgi:hypothetical protein
VWREVVESIAQRSVSVLLDAARRSRFPSVLLQPLGHLSVYLESITCERLVSDYHTRHRTFLAPTRTRLDSASLNEQTTRSEENCVRPRNVARALTAILGCGPPEQDERPQMPHRSTFRLRLASGSGSVRDSARYLPQHSPQLDGSPGPRGNRLESIGGTTVFRDPLTGGGI